MVPEPDPNYEIRKPSVSDRSFRLIALVTLIGVVAVLGGVVTLTIYRFQDSATLSGQRTVSERSDCARTISNEQTEVKDHRDALRDRITEAYARNSLGLPQVEDPYNLLAEFSKARQAVADLRPTQQLVDERCPAP